MSLLRNAILVGPGYGARQKYAESLREHGFDVDETDGVDSAVTRFASGRYDAVVLQLEQNGSTASDAVESFQNICPHTPIVLGYGADLLHRVEIHRAGEVQTLDGPVREPSLLAMTVALNVAQADGDRLKRENQRLRYQATMDALTGIHNRRFLLERLEQEIERTQRFGSCFSVLMIDLDNFKTINDTFGHAAGDETLIKVASYLSTNLRGVDTVARYGGDEFVILLVQANSDVAASVAERLRAGLTGLRMYSSTAARPWTLTASMGVYTHSQGGPADTRSVLAKADEALYASKRDGGDRASCAAA